MSDANRNSRSPHQLQPPNFGAGVPSIWSHYPGAQGRQHWGSPAPTLSEGPEADARRYVIALAGATQLDPVGPAALDLWPPAAYPLGGSIRLRDRRSVPLHRLPQTEHPSGRPAQRIRSGTLPQSVSQQGYEWIDTSLSVSNAILGASGHPRWLSCMYAHALSRLQATVRAAQ